MEDQIKEIEKISLYTPLEFSKEVEIFLRESSDSKSVFLDASTFVWDSYLKYLNRVPDKGGYFSNIESLLVSKVDKKIIENNLEQSEEYKTKNRIPEVSDKKSIIEYINQNKNSTLEGFSVKIYAPFGTSGYSDAVLDYIYLITMNGGEVSFFPTDLQGNVDLNTAKNIKYQIAINCMYKEIVVDNVWIYTTPLVWESIVKIEKNKNKNVKTYGMYIWETDDLRAEVIHGMNNSVDVVLATSEYNVHIFKKYITKPLYCIHHVIRLISHDVNTNVIKANSFLTNLQKLSEDNFIFYVIAHWNPRKDIDKLLSAFTQAFSKNDNVKLVLKTFLHSHGDENNILLKTYIEEKYNNKNILPNFDLMTIEEIQELHKICNCFVSTSHSEGVGFSIVLAAMQNKVLAPKFSGYMDYVKDINPIKYTIENVDLNYPPLYEEFEKYYPDYKTNMKWVSVDTNDLIEQLRHMRNNVEQNYINRIYTANTFSYNNIVGEILGVFNINNIYQNTLNILEKFVNQELEFNVLRSYVKTLFTYDQGDIYEKACVQIRNQYNLPEMHYVFQYFESENHERQYEMEFCLENILVNPFITKVHCLSEKEYDFSKFYLVAKINQTVVKNRLTFKQAFDYCNLELSKKVCIFANNDIYFDSTLYYLTQLENLENFFVALSRHDYDINTHGLKPFNVTNDGVHEYSQDVWVFKTPIKKSDEMEFFQGVQGCDNRIAYLFDKLGYYVVNPCETITTIHMHTSEVRNPITNSKKTRFTTNLKNIRSTNIAVVNNIQKLFKLYFDREATVLEFSNMSSEIEIYKKEHVINLKLLRKILIFITTDRSYKLVLDIISDNNITPTPEVKVLFDKGIDIPTIIEKCVYAKREYLTNNINSVVNNCNKNILEREDTKITFDNKMKLKDFVLLYKELDEVTIKEKLTTLFKNQFKFYPEKSKIELMFKLYMDAKSIDNDFERLDDIIFQNIVEPSELIENAYMSVLGRSVDRASLDEQLDTLEKHGIENYYNALYTSEEYHSLGKARYVSKVKALFLI